MTKKDLKKLYDVLEVAAEYVEPAHATINRDFKSMSPRAKDKVLEITLADLTNIKLAAAQVKVEIETT